MRTSTFFVLAGPKSNQVVQDEPEEGRVHDARRPVEEVVVEVLPPAPPRLCRRERVGRRGRRDARRRRGALRRRRRVVRPAAFEVSGKHARRSRDETHCN